MVPMVYPEKLNWASNNVGLPITILNSGTQLDIATNDWPDAMQWLRENTPEDAVIAAWWDYGYWISALGERKTLADNSTVLDWQIRKIAAMYMSTPENAWHILTSDTETNLSSYYVTLPNNIIQPTRHSSDAYDESQNKSDLFKIWKDDPKHLNAVGVEQFDPDIANTYSTLFDYWESEVYVLPQIITGLDADYVIINLAASKLSGENIVDLYTLRQHGGDETKAYWLFQIADLRVSDYYNPELTSYTDKFWNETFFASLIPFTPLLYVDPNNLELTSTTFEPGYVAIYVKDVKFPTNGDGPFELVYVPPSFEKDEVGHLTGPLIYKINKDYNPNQ
jgi:dolichyl-diphosphooligosaccharide--protein glycosyltransferase